MAKRKYAAKSSKSKRSKKGRKPRGQRSTNVFSYVRTTTSNYSGTLGLSLKTNAAGLPQWTSGLTQGSTLQFVFTLGGVGIYIDGALAFTAPLPSYTEYTALYDNYRIDKVEIMAMTTYDGNNVTAGTVVGQLPYIVFTEDYDDASATTATEIMQYTTAKWTNLTTGTTGKPMKLMSITPRAQMQMYAATTNNLAMAPAKLWLDAGSPSIPHFGFKMALDNPGNGIAYAVNTLIGTVNFVFKFHLSMKTVR